MQEAYIGESLSYFKIADYDSALNSIQQALIVIDEKILQESEQLRFTKSSKLQ